MSPTSSLTARPSNVYYLARRRRAVRAPRLSIEPHGPPSHPLFWWRLKLTTVGDGMPCAGSRRRRRLTPRSRAAREIILARRRAGGPAGIDSGPSRPAARLRAAPPKGSQDQDRGPRGPGSFCVQRAGRFDSAAGLSTIRAPQMRTITKRHGAHAPEALRAAASG